MNWVSDDNNKRLQDIRERFVQAMKEVSRQSSTNYYDFLLVAKQLGFRFEEANHLMSLKNYFMRNKNQLDKRRLSDLLMVHSGYLRNGNDGQDKLIVKFNVPQSHFDPIQQVTNEDEEYYGEEEDMGGLDSQSWQDGQKRNTSSGQLHKLEHTQSDMEHREKIEIIVSIKMQEMTKRLAIISSCENLLENFITANRSNVNLAEFRKGILKIFSESKERQKISEDDIRTLFYMLDTEKIGQLTEDKFNRLTRMDKFTQELRQFYRSRVNPALIKNTEFKKGKYKNQIQIFQVKNPSVLELQQIEKAVINQKTLANQDREELKKSLIVNRKPHFGPLKHSTYNRRRQTGHNLIHEKEVMSAPTSVWMQRDRIQKILKASKERRRQHHSNETIASKLRSLFIHKVILPREKMLDQEKEQENKFRRTKGMGSYLAIKPIEKR